MKGLDNQLIETSIHTKTYTNDNKRPVLDNEGNPVMENIQGSQIFESVEVLDGEGNPTFQTVPVLDENGDPTYNIISQPLMIGVVDFWNQTLTAISPNYIR